MWGYGGVGLWFEEYIIFDNIIGGRFWWKGFEEYILMLFWGRFWWKGFEEYILMLFLCGEFVSGNSCGGMGEGFGGDFVWDFVGISWGFRVGFCGDFVWDFVGISWGFRVGFCVGFRVGDFMHSRPYPLERRLAFGRVFGGDVGGGVCGRIWRR